jgi:hypothetical protein
MSSHEILHVRITKRAGDRKHTVDAVVQDQATSTCNAFAFILIATLMVIGQSKRLSITAQDDAGISNVRRVEDALARC